MAKARLAPVYSRGRATITALSIAANSTTTQTIALPRSDFLHGFMLVGVPVGVSGSANRRANAAIYFTTTTGDACSQATVITTTSFYDYVFATTTFNDFANRAYFYDADSKLSEEYFSDDSTINIRIDSVVINGSNIEIVLRNTHATLARTTTLQIEWRVEIPANL